VLYENRDAALELSLGFSNGFRLQYTGPRTFNDKEFALSGAI
jgi:hypothetical protein